ncbi:MAG: hypothetical protein AAFX04_13135 [Pseudomonadota bacterium]
MSEDQTQAQFYQVFLKIENKRENTKRLQSTLRWLSPVLALIVISLTRTDQEVARVIFNIPPTF